MTTSAPESDDEQYERAFSRVGSTLAGKWTLKRLLGVGGMAAVFEAAHKNGRRVAIKVLHVELNQYAEAKERFLNEAYVANHVAHSGTVPALDDGVTEDGALYMVMDLLEGETLEDRWQKRDGVLPVQEVFRLTEELLDILGTAHERGVVHRDVKPENVFLTSDDDVKLLDFGIARMEKSQRSNKTQMGSTMGTPAFMPPEQARGRWEDVDEQSDVWSVGATMFALICGRTVHEADTNNELLLASMTQPAPDVRNFAPGIPEAAAQVIEKALAFEKADRYATAAEMQRAVQDALVALTEQPLVQQVSSAPPPPGFGPHPSTFPLAPSTFRPVARSERPTVVQEDVHSLSRRKRVIAVAAALVASLVVGYLFTSSSSSEELAPVSAAHQATERDEAERTGVEPHRTEAESAPEESGEVVRLEDLPEEPTEVVETRRTVRRAPAVTPTEKLAEKASQHAEQSKSEVDARSASPVTPRDSGKSKVPPQTDGADDEPFDPLSLRR